MRLIIVSGRSGSGKTILLHVLEDLGYYCVDNLPAVMLPGLIATLASDHALLAVSIDARNLPDKVEALKDVIAELRRPDWHTDIIYLDADEKHLLQRFSETRRRHPLSNAQVSLQEAISKEKILLNPLASLADLTIDTSHLSQHQLCSLIQDRMGQANEQRLQLQFQSFGYKNGIPADADIIFDVRCLPNPYWEPTLRSLTGQDLAVENYLSEYPQVHEMIDDILHYLKRWVSRFEANNRSYLTVCIGCTGGKHRSVYLSEQLFQRTKPFHQNIQLRHRDL